MGKAAADVQREIEELRTETSLLVTELESRVKDATNVRVQARRHPAIAAGVGLAFLSGLAFAGYAVYQRAHEVRKPQPRLRKQPRDEKRRRQSSIFGAETDERSEEHMLKKVLYAAFTAGLVALATFLARRTAETIWTRTMEERPPNDRQERPE